MSEVALPDVRATAWVCYRFYDAHQNLIYVGATRNMDQRIYEHSFKTPWFSTVASVEVEHFESRVLARQREAELIAEFMPVHNTYQGEGHRMTPVLIKFPQALLDQMDEAAQAENKTRSVWVRDACKEKLGLANPTEGVAPPRVETCPHPPHKRLDTPDGTLCQTCGKLVA